MRKLSLRISCGENTCRASNGAYCDFLRGGSPGNYSPSCCLFRKFLELDSVLPRLPECLEAEPLPEPPDTSTRQRLLEFFITAQEWLEDASEERLNDVVLQMGKLSGGMTIATLTNLLRDYEPHE